MKEEVDLACKSYDLQNNKPPVSFSIALPLVVFKWQLTVDELYYYIHIQTEVNNIMK